MKVIRRAGALVLCLCLLLTLTGCDIVKGLLGVTELPMMIYEVYTSGGYVSAKNVSPYKHCYVVLYNPSGAETDLEGMTLKYMGGLSADVEYSVALTGSVAAKRFYTIELGPCSDALEGAAGTELPFTPNVAALDIHPARKSGKFALCAPEGAGAQQVASGDAFVIDFLGYGGKAEDVDDYERSPAIGVTVKKLLRRRTDFDAGINGDDFTTVDIIDRPGARVAYTADTTYEQVMAAWEKAKNDPKEEANRPVINFSQPGGYYSSDVTLSLSTDWQGATIYYTVDGSPPLNRDGSPSETAEAYTGALTLKDRTGEPTRLMDIPGTTFADGDSRFIWPPVQHDGESDAAYEQRLTELFNSQLKINTIRAQAIDADGIRSEVATESYFIFPQTFKELFGDLPVLSLTVDADGLYDEQTGIWQYENIENRGAEWELDAHLEFFNSDATLGFETGISMRLHGGYTRAFPQKAIRVYPDGGLTYDLFDGRVTAADGQPMTYYEAFILRSGGNDWYAASLRDAFWQTYCAQLGSFETQGYRPSVMFLDGEFWGLYNIRERYNRTTLATRYGVDPNDIVIVEAFTSLNSGEPGDEHVSINLRNFIWENDMSDPANYEVVKEQLDIDSYVDYMICEIFGGNQDWPHNNLVLWRNKNTANGMDTKWRMAMIDLDYAFTTGSGGVTSDTIAYLLNDAPHDGGLMFKNLLSNDEFRRHFVSRFDELLDDFLTYDKTSAWLDSMRAEVEQVTPMHRARWNLDMGAWEGTFSYIKEFLQARGDVLRTSIQTNIIDVYGE